MVETVESQWSVMRDGKDYGCFPESLLRKWITAGKVASDVKLSCGGAWISVADFLGTQKSSQEIGLANDVAPSSALEGNLPDLTAIELAERSTSESPDDTTIASALPDAPPPAPATLVRDRIVVLGRRQSGKTIYLATLYALLWRQLRGLSAKSLTGTGHHELITVAETLQEGNWPPATQGSTRIELEIAFNGLKRTLVTLDFAGELFAKAFLHDRGDSPAVKPLLDHIDRAAAMMLLVDPEVTVGRDREAAMEDDFGLVQAVERLRNWHGGENVPVVFLLTKSDIHQPIVQAAGGPVAFVKQHFPALARTLQKIPIYQVSAVQCAIGIDGRPCPRPNSTPVNIEKPLIYCLQAIERMEQDALQQRAEQAARQVALECEQQRRMRERRQNRWLVFVVAMIFALGGVVLAWVIRNGFFK